MLAAGCGGRNAAVTGDGGPPDGSPGGGDAVTPDQRPLSDQSVSDAVVRPLSDAGPAGAVVSVDPAKTVGAPIKLQISTQLVWATIVEPLPAAVSALDAYAPTLVRIHAGTDGTCVPTLPEGDVKNAWDTSSLDALIGDIRNYGGEPYINVRYAPNWMWTCTTYFSGGAAGVGSLSDPTYNQFGDYMARLVSYYNLGHATLENGTTVTNPKGTSYRFNYWEIWNEPEFSNETPCHPADWSAALSPTEYAKMWTVVSAKMLAVDPTIKLVGPSDVEGYIPPLLATPRPPDVISYHDYGYWDNTVSDQVIFDGDASGSGGIPNILSDLATAQMEAPGKPIWLTEINVNADWGNDPAMRPWNPYSVAWGASAFRALALAGLNLMNEYGFMTGSQQFDLVNSCTGTPMLPYWRDYWLSREFPPGSVVLSSSSTAKGVETLAVRPPGSTQVHLLVVNRQVPNATVVGSPGVPVTVQVKIALPSVSKVVLRLMDATTDPTHGPAAVALPAATSVAFHFAGYGAAIFEISP